MARIRTVNSGSENGTDKQSHVYGPVPSRRLGRSLGIDLVPYKTCTYDCVYCQLGRTTHKTCRRREYLPLSGIISELKATLNRGVQPDVITISGSGEPTLHSRLGQIIARAKKLSHKPLAVLTNGSLLWDPEVADACAEADLVLPSLDAATPLGFTKINRPTKEIAFATMVDGLVEFSRRFKGELWLEVMLVVGYNDQPEEISRLANLIERIQPDRVQLNTVARTPAEAFARPVEPAQMDSIASAIARSAEVIADYTPVGESTGAHAGRTDILNLLARRPCSVDGIVAALRMHRNVVVKVLESLLRDEKITADRAGSQPLYRLARD
jgi:wyosine [tRNA(Phe)-imidazoG37] synthetase (radical SAM superfamily)